MRVLTFDECSERAGFTRRTFERLLAMGEGPAVIALSARRRGVLETDFEAWIISRRHPAPGASATAVAAPLDAPAAPVKPKRGRPRKVPAVVGV